MYQIQQNLFDIPDDDIDEIIPSNDNCSLGTISELMFAIKAKELGFDVYMPIGHAQKADLIICRPQNKPKLIQVKKATQQTNSSWQISTSSKKRTSQFGSVYTKYNIGDFDILAAHIAQLDIWALWRIDEVAGKSSVRWNKFETHRNNFDLLDI